MSGCRWEYAALVQPFLDSSIRTLNIPFCLFHNDMVIYGYECDVAAAASWCDKICIMSPAEVFGNEAIVGIFSSQAIRFSLLALNASFSGVNVNTVPNSTIDNATFTTTV
ncbi:hypothetical protein E4U38_003324 [Claviceps purpurea]|nr:hypothetical protein E4U38_003324 [Claviceps purpurea]